MPVNWWSLSRFDAASSTGIGLATVRHLARAGATVYLAARNEARASAAIAQLAGEGLTEITWLKLDLDDPRDAQKAAQEFLRREKRLDILSEFRKPFVRTTSTQVSIS